MNTLPANDTTFDTLEARLHEVAREIGNGAPGAEATLQALLSDLRASADPRAVGLFVFAGAMARRMAGQSASEANLYLAQFEVPQIELFNLLGRAVPFVGLATAISNNAIARAIEKHAEATVIDVGIGTGRQMSQLIEMLATARDAGTLALRHLTVVGIEPSDWALDQAARNVRETARTAGIALTFVPVYGAAESLSADEWTRIEEASDTDALVINASFALHHIADTDGCDQRDAVLQRLRALDPALLVLSEPDVDHLEPGFYNRFRNCYAHFGAVFRALDALALAQRDRDALKVGFFGREVSDILSNPDAERSERHESAHSWLRRLNASGFEPRVDGALPAVDPATRHAVGLARRAYHVSINAIDEPVVSVFLAVPARASVSALA